MANLQALIKSAFLALVVLVFVPSVYAARIQMSHFPPNPGVLPGGGWKFTAGTTFANPPSQRMWVDGVYGGVRGIAATDSVLLSGRAGALAVQAAQVLTSAEAAAVAARCLGSPACVGLTAGAAASVYLWDQYRVRSAPGGGLEADDGQVQSSINAYCFNNPLTCASEPMDAFTQWSRVKIKAVVDNPPGGATCFVEGTARHIPSSNLVTGLYVNCYNGSGSLNSTWPIEGNYSPQTVKECPAVVDFSNPAYSVPGGPLVIDGKCPTGRYNRIDQSTAATKIAAFPQDASSPALKDAARESVDVGQQSAPADIQVTGPGSQTGTPVTTTTTGPDGTTTQTKTDTYTYTYAGDTITYATTNTTQTCTGSNSCSTTTTNPPPPTEQDPDDPCTANPDRAGCAKLGNAPSAEDINKKDIPISISAEGGFGASNGSCPGPITLRNGSVVDPYGLVCTYMSGIRFAVIGVAWLIAALIFLGRID